MNSWKRKKERISTQRHVVLVYNYNTTTTNKTTLLCSVGPNEALIVLCTIYTLLIHLSEKYSSVKSLRKKLFAIPDCSTWKACMLTDFELGHRIHSYILPTILVDSWGVLDSHWHCIDLPDSHPQDITLKHWPVDWIYLGAALRHHEHYLGAPPPIQSKKFLLGNLSFRRILLLYYLNYILLKPYNIKYLLILYLKY